MHTNIWMVMANLPLATVMMGSALEGQILSEMLRQCNVNNAILIETCVHGGTNLLKARFNLIRRVAADGLDKFTDHKVE